MADARLTKITVVVVLVLLLLVCYLLTRFQNQAEIARVKEEVGRLEREKDSIQAFAAANVAVQEILQLTIAV